MPQRGSEAQANRGPRSYSFALDEVLDRLPVEAVAFIDRSSEANQPILLNLPLTACHAKIWPRPCAFAAPLFAVSTGTSCRTWTRPSATCWPPWIRAVSSDRHARDLYLRQWLLHGGGGGQRWIPLITLTFPGGCIITGAITGSGKWRPARNHQGHRIEGGHGVTFLVRWPAMVDGGFRRPPRRSTSTEPYATLAEIVGEVDGTVYVDRQEQRVTMLRVLRGEPVTRGIPVSHRWPGSPNVCHSGRAGEAGAR